MGAEGGFCVWMCVDVCLQNRDGSTSVAGLTTVEVTRYEEVLEYMELAASHRAVGTHNVNEHSSRSHLVVTVSTTVQHADGPVTHGKMNLIDLAGSERLSKTAAVGQALKEAQCINKSLSALGDVIQALAKRSSHVPFRNSKLTHLLQDSLGGSGKVAMFCNVSPVQWNLSET